MKGRSVAKVLSGLTIFMLMMTPCLAVPGEVAVICHPSVPENSLGRDAVQQIFLGNKTRWTNNDPIHFAVLKEGHVHETFLKEFVGRSDSQFTMFWKKMVFTGKGRMPLTFNTPEEMVRYVAQTPGAVGYAPVGATGESVKVLQIN